MQINAIMPAGLPDGQAALMASLGGNVSQQGVTIYVGSN
jgi:uncharacterized protein (TIGR03437 family)